MMVRSDDIVNAKEGLPAIEQGVFRLALRLFVVAPAPDEHWHHGVEHLGGVLIRIRQLGSLMRQWPIPWTRQICRGRVGTAQY